MVLKKNVVNLVKLNDKTIFKVVRCKENDCYNQAFSFHERCALHCIKNIKDVDDRKLVSDFHQELNAYIISKLKVKDIEDYHGANLKILAEQTLNNRAKIASSQQLIDFIRGRSISFEGIQFPSIAVLNQNSIIQLLCIFENIIFKNCGFYSNFFDLRKTSVHYEGCIFYNEYSIEVTVIPSTNYSELYTKCTFKKPVILKGKEDYDKIDFNVFKDCNFIEKLKVVNIEFSKNLLIFPHIGEWSVSSTEDKRDLVKNIKECYEINSLLLINCIFNESFFLNGANREQIRLMNSIAPKVNLDFIIKKLVFRKCYFKSKLEIKNRTIYDLDFYNSNVDGIADFFKSRIYEAAFTKSIFEEFAAFEKVIFGKKERGLKEVIFRYTTFKDFSTFRDAKFLSGLSFSNANIKQEPNFLNAYVSMCGTDRETFRIIKNSFDDVGNKIEANRFFIKEMQSYRKEIYSDTKEKEDVSFWDKIIYSLNDNISSFGQSYIRPIRLLFLSMILYSLLLYKHKLFFLENQYLISIDFFCIDKISNRIFELLNDSAENLLPFSRFLVKKDGMEFISLLFYIWFAILIWQIVVAVKRHTQR